MAGRGMGAAVRGGGAVGSGPKNKMVSEPSKKTGKVLMMSKGGQASRQAALGMQSVSGGSQRAVKMAMGGDVNQHKRMAMGMMGGGMARGYKKGGMAKKKVKVKKMRYGGSCG